MALRRISIRRQFSLILSLVILLNGVIFFFMLQSVYKEELRAQAQTVVSNVEAFGSWVAKNGRVWVRDNPDSYLGQIKVIEPDSPEDEIHFYSKNPALAQREFSEAVLASESPATFRMTSTNVMNPQNAPDEFEVRALAKISAEGLDEYFETVAGDYRYAKPVFHTASCIACHGDPISAPSDVIARYGNENGFGFSVGDVAGIVSVTIPKRNFLNGAAAVFGGIQIGVIALSVVLILWFVSRRVITPLTELTTVAETISTGESANLDTSKIDFDTKNEIDQLRLATGRMATSLSISMRKMSEYKKAATQAIKVAKAYRDRKQEADKKD